MAQMIPDICISESYLEKKFFSFIKDAKGTDDWIVFHTTKFDSAANEKEGECDFIIIIPDSGIFIIEAKGGKIIYCNGDKFKSIDKNNIEYDIYPFVQLEKEKRELSNLLEANGLNDIPIFGLVMFDGQKKDHLISRLNSDKMNDIYFYGVNKIVDFVKEIYNRYNGTQRFNNDCIEAIKESFKNKPNFTINSNLSIQTEAIIDNSTANLIDEKIKEIIDGDKIISSRALIYGGAGTGKTYFASTLLKKLIELNRFKKIAFFSYNKLFSYKMKLLFKDKVDNETLIIEPIIEFFRDYSKKCGLNVDMPKNDGDKEAYLKKVKFYYSVIVYERFMEAIYSNPLSFDVIIIDEAQDIVNPRAIVALSLILDKKIYGGNWYLFGDFTHQLIYESSVSKNDMNQYLLSMGFDEEDDYKRIPLNINCRNSKSIVDELNDQFKQNIIPKDNAILGKVRYKPYNNKDNEIKSLEILLDKLINKNGISPNQISILSNNPDDEEVVLKKIQDEIKLFSFNDFKNREDGQISVSKVRRFKGLENHIIILIDLNEYLERDTNKQNIDILYIGLSRALSDVYIYETESEKEYRLKERERMGMSTNGKIISQ